MDTTKTAPSPSELRQAEKRRREDEARLIRRTIRREIGEYRPMGRLSEVAEAMGYRPKRGVVTNTPLGPIVFAKARRPAQHVLNRWRKLWAEADALDAEALTFLWFVAEPGRITGNRLPMKRGQELERLGLLDPEEVAYLRQLEAFWAAHPNAECGVVQEDGSIRPWRS